MPTKTKKPKKGPISNATKRKVKKAKAMAPISPERLERLNAARVKKGMEPLSAVAVNKAKKQGPEAMKALTVKPKAVVIPPREIAPSETPVNELLGGTGARVIFREGGMLDVKDDITAGEVVSLVAFFAGTAKSAGLHIGTLIVHCEKKKKATLDEIALATKLERKTLHNYASAVRTTSAATIEGAMRKAAKSGKELTFSHVAAVAGLEPDKRKELLDEAATDGMTITVLNAKVRKLAPKTAKRAKAATKREAAQKAAADAKEAAAVAAATGTPPADTNAAPGLTVVDAPLSEADEEATDKAQTDLDSAITFIRGKTFELLPKKRKVQFVKPLRQLADAYASLMAELENIQGLA